MKRATNRLVKNMIVRVGFFLTLVFCLAACTPAQTQLTEAPVSEMDSSMEHEGDHEMDDMDHDHSDEEADVRIPNDGAVIKIVSPADGAAFNKGQDILVEIETENFDLNAEGNHWHLYVDGSVWTMISEGSTKSPLHGLDSGQHEIAVYLGLPTHEELEDGASVSITVNE